MDDVSAFAAEVVIEVRQVRADGDEGLSGGAGGHGASQRALSALSALSGLSGLSAWSGWSALSALSALSGLCALSAWITSRLICGLSTPLSSCRRISARTDAFAWASSRRWLIASSVSSYRPQSGQSTCTVVAAFSAAVRPQKRHLDFRVEFTCVAPPCPGSLQPDAGRGVPAEHRTLAHVNVEHRARAVPSLTHDSILRHFVPRGRRREARAQRVTDRKSTRL